MYKTVPHPLQCSCLENPRDGGAWWAAVYGVTQSRTRLKWLSSSSSSSAKDIGLNNFLVEADGITLIPCFWGARGSLDCGDQMDHPRKPAPSSVQLCELWVCGLVRDVMLFICSSAPIQSQPLPFSPRSQLTPMWPQTGSLFWPACHHSRCRWSLSPGCCLSPSPTSVLHCQPSLASLPSQLFYCWSL